MIYIYKTSPRPYNEKNPVTTYSYNTDSGLLICHDSLKNTVITQERGLIASNYLAMILNLEVVSII